MAQVIKKATRESFGMALCELAKTNKDIIVLMQTSQLLQRQEFLKRVSRKIF